MIGSLPALHKLVHHSARGSELGPHQCDRKTSPNDPVLTATLQYMVVTNAQEPAYISTMSCGNDPWLAIVPMHRGGGRRHACNVAKSSQFSNQTVHFLISGVCCHRCWFGCL